MAPMPLVLGTIKFPMIGLRKYIPIVKCAFQEVIYNLQSTIYNYNNF